MSGVNKSLELVRITLTGRSCKVSCNVITKWAIIGMLLNGHNLNTVVSVCFDSRKDVVRKFFVWRNFLIFWAHTYVTFINQKRISGSNWSLMLKLVRLWWVPKYTIKKIAIFVLLDKSWPSRIFIGLVPVWISYLNLIPLQVFDLRCAVWVCRQSQVPDSELVFDGLVLRSIPRIEISELISYFGTWYLPV